MNIVIDIPDKKYHAILNHAKEILDPFSFIEPQYLYLAVINGTPLPEHHGRLIDASNLMTVTDYDGENEKTYISYDEIENAPTIVEAESEE